MYTFVKHSSSDIQDYAVNKMVRFPFLRPKYVGCRRIVFSQPFGYLKI